MTLTIVAGVAAEIFVSASISDGLQGSPMNLYPTPGGVPIQSPRMPFRPEQGWQHGQLDKLHQGEIAGDGHPAHALVDLIVRGKLVKKFGRNSC